MATRMATLLYGDKPGADVEPGNRVDTTNGGTQAPPPLRPSSLARRSHEPFALRGVVVGLAAAAAILAGAALSAIAIAWSRSLAPPVQVSLIVIGLVMIAGGTAYVVSASPRQTTR